MPAPVGSSNKRRSSVIRVRPSTSRPRRSGSSRFLMRPGPILTRSVALRSPRRSEVSTTPRHRLGLLQLNLKHQRLGVSSRGLTYSEANYKHPLVPSSTRSLTVPERLWNLRATLAAMTGRSSSRRRRGHTPIPQGADHRGRDDAHPPGPRARARKNRGSIRERV